MRLRLTVQGREFDIACAEDKSPRTLSRLAGLLPLSLQLHTPKIAGSHIYWHAPFVEDVEGGVDVLSARPGAFIYWPVRQFLEITFAPLQAETASVSVLGHLDGPVEDVTRLAGELRDLQGSSLFSGRLEMIDPGAIAPMPPEDDASLPRALLEARDQVWSACPSDIARMLESRAIMHPVGPVLMAESEARVLHETLWWLRERLGRDGEGNLRYAGALAANKAATRLRDFCHMVETPRALFGLESAFGNADVALPPLVDLGIVLSGRIAAWCDLQIAWNPMNEAFRKAIGSRNGEGF